VGKLLAVPKGAARREDWILKVDTSDLDLNLGQEFS